MVEKERHAILETLTEEQRQFLCEHIKRSKCDIWTEHLARIKGIDKSLDNMEEVDDFLLVDIRDGGYGNRPYRCKCGKSLRYQYILKHSRKDIELRLGSECFKNIAGMEDTFLKEVKKGFTRVNGELDDILQKVLEDSFQFTIYDMYRHIIPELLQEQLDLELPFSNKQIYKIEKYMQEDEVKQEIKNLSLTKDQTDLIEELPLDDQEQLIIKLKNGQVLYHLADIENIHLSDIVERKIALGIPLKDMEENQVRKALKADEKISKVGFSRVLENHGALIRRISSSESQLRGDAKRMWEDIQLSIERAKQGKNINGSELVVGLLAVAQSLNINIDNYYS